MQVTYTDFEGMVLKRDAQTLAGLGDNLGVNHIEKRTQQGRGREERKYVDSRLGQLSDSARTCLEVCRGVRTPVQPI